MNDRSAIAEYMDRFRDAMRARAWPTRRIEREVLDHLLASVDASVAAGLPRLEAERRAVEEFGSPDALIDEFVEARGPIGDPRLARISAAVGALLIVPAFLFVVANLLKYNFGNATLYDGFFATMFDLSLWRSTRMEALANGVIVGGPLLALALTALVCIRVDLRRESGAVAATVAVRLTKGHIAVAVVSVLLLATMAAYLLLENLPCLVGGRVEC